MTAPTHDSPADLLRSVADTLIVAANNPVAHGRERGLRDLMKQQAVRILEALTPPEPRPGGQAVAGETADDLVRLLGLEPERFRTEGGSINHMRLKAAILHPNDYTTPELAGSADADGFTLRELTQALTAHYKAETGDERHVPATIMAFETLRSLRSHRDAARATAQGEGKGHG